MRTIPNNQLKLELIPDPEGDFSDWPSFAHTINGYEVAGSFEACADLANAGPAISLTELRCVLFFEARRDRHSGGLADVEPAVRRLLRAIREKVANQELS